MDRFNLMKYGMVHNHLAVMARPLVVRTTWLEVKVEQLSAGAIRSYMVRDQWDWLVVQPD